MKCLQQGDKGRSLFTLVAVLLICLPWRLGMAGQELVVSAAASLTNAFKEVGTAFATKHPEAKVILNFAASGVLLQQIERGAPADVFASADQESMDLAQAKALIASDTRRDFTSNRLVLVVPSEAPALIDSLDDLTGSAVKRIAVGKPETVAVGRYTREALDLQRLWEPLTAKFIYANSVRQVVDYVSRGEVDAGFVYSTDATVAREKLKIIAEINTKTPITYPIAVVSASKRPSLAANFVDFVLSQDGQSILANYGFRRP